MISKIEKLIEVFFRVISRYSSKLYTFHSRPRYARLFEKKSHAFNYAELCVIIQGDIKNINFLQETIQIYKNCVFPGSCILISTWYDENKKHLRSIEKLGVEVLVSEKPENRGASNINLQITSTRRAVECAALKNVRYLMKTRTDQRINAVNTYPYLLALTKQFPPSSAENGGRLIGLSLNSFKYRLYGISDMFMFGSLNEMQKYWSPPLDSRTEHEVSADRNLSLREYSKLALCEVYLMTKYLETIGHEILWTLEDSLAAYRKYFCVIDASSIDFYWEKYSKKEYRWFDYTKNKKLEEITFRDWMVLVSDPSYLLGDEFVLD